VTEPVTHRPGNRCASGGDAVEQRTETGSGGSPSGGLHADIRRALTMSPEHRSTVVDGCVIRWLAWGEPRGPAVLFVHGGAAHSWWWSFTAPLLADRHRVLAIDLSGHGDSGRRERYSFTTWAAEINAVLDVESSTDPVLVGHSMGGIVATVAAVHRQGPLAGLVLVDAPLSNAHISNFDGEHGTLGRTRTYRTKDEAVARFRPLPPQPVTSDELVAHIARHSVRRTPDGQWTWKFDPSAFTRIQPDRPAELWSLIHRLTCPVGAIVAERSTVVIPQDRARLTGPQDGSHPRIACQLLDGNHHVMLDRPVELVQALRALLDEWSDGATDEGGTA